MNAKKTSRPSDPLRLSRETIQHLRVKTSLMTGPSGPITPKGCLENTLDCVIRIQ